MNPLGRIFGPGRQIENFLKKAEAAFGHGEWEKCAQAAIDCQGKITPDNPGKFANELLRAYYLEAGSLFKLGNVEKALVTIRRALDQSEGLADIAKLLFDIAGESDHEDILELLELAVKKIPGNNHVALALCEKYVDIEKFDEESVSVFSRMHSRATDNKKVTYGLAMCYRKIGKYDRTALAIYRRAFHEFSMNQDFLYGLARTYASQSPPITEALPVIERALKFFPDEDLFHKSKVVILSNLPSLIPEQVKLLLAEFKKTKDKELAGKLVGHLLTTHADDEDACRVYEEVWKDHPKRITLLSILAERYRMAGRRDPQAMEIFQAFFEDMPREQENTLNLARRHAEHDNTSENAILVYQQALRDGTGADLDNVVLALAHSYLRGVRADEEAARIYRMAHNVEPGNYAILTALKDVAMSGGRLDGSRANPLINYIKNSKTPKADANVLAEKLGPVLARDERSDREASHIYRMNVANLVASDEEEKLLVLFLIETKKTKIRDIPILERVYANEDSDQLATALADLYRQTGEPSEKYLPVIIRVLNLNPTNRKLGGWVLPYLLNQHGQDRGYLPLISNLIVRGHLSSANGIRAGTIGLTVTRIARDKIRDGNFKDSISVLSEAFKFDKNPILQYLLGVSYQGSGDLQTGIGVFKDLLKVEKQNPAYSYRIAVLKLMSGDIGGADKELKKLQKLHPDHPMVLLRRAMILEARGDPEGAMKDYERIRSGDQSVLAFSAYRKGIIHCSKGEWREGLKLLDRAAGGGISSISLETARYLSRITLADREIADESLENAERHLKELSSNQKPPWPGIVNERYLRLGILHLKNKIKASAQRVLETAIQSRPTEARVASLLAMLNIAGGRPKAATERLEKTLAIRNAPGSELAHRLWCVISMRLGKHDEAREAADWLIARKAKDAGKLRFLAVWRNPIEVDWPPSLDRYTYIDLEKEFGFPVGLIGRMAYKRADYKGGAKFLEVYFKDKKKPDRVEAEFLLGLMYIKLKKPNLGLHYWSEILSEGYKELSGKQRIDGLMLLGYHFLEHGEPEKSRQAFTLAGEAGAVQDDIDLAMSLSHLHAGYLEAKADNLLGAIREWEKVQDSSSKHWQALQNLALGHLWMDNDTRAMQYFDELFVLCDKNPDAINDEDFSFVFEETRKMINQLVSLKQVEETRGEVKREMLLEEIHSSNRHYWTLGVKKGITSEEAQANYFRLVKIYNPEKYPQDFMVLEKAYEFFNKPGLLKKNEQKVFNAFHFRQLGLEVAGGLSEIPPSPQVVEYVRRQLDPVTQVDLQELLDESYSLKEKLPELNTSPDFNVPDYLASW